MFPVRASLPNAAGFSAGQGGRELGSQHGAAMPGAGGAIASLVALQLFAKLVNFALNVLVVRATGAKLFGVSAVPLALLLSTIQFLSREGVRGACQRIDVARAGQPPDAAATRADLARVVNLSWAVLPLALCVAPLCAAAAVWRGYDGVESEEYRTLVVVFGLAAVLELLVEPAYNLVVVCDKLHVRAAVDGLAITAKAAVVYACVTSTEIGVLAFAWGQAAYALAQLAGLYGYAAWRAAAAGGGAAEDFPLGSLSQLLPAPLPPAGAAALVGGGSWTARWFGESSAAEASALCRQSLIKHLLTEADKLLLLASNAGADATGGNVDAVYGVVFNLGSLAGRLVFEPVETQSRLQFGRLAATQRALSDATAALASGTAQGVEQRAALEAATRTAGADHAARWQELIPALRARLRLLGSLGLLFVAFGPAYSWLLLHLLYGEEWSSTSAPQALAAYCVYVLLMAINGLAEAFRDSVATGAQLSSLSPSSLTGFMLISFCLCCCFSLWAVPAHGAVGIIAANCLNLSLRIVYSCHFIVYRVPTPDGVPPELTVRAALMQAVPGVPVLGALGLAFAATQLLLRPEAVGGATFLETLWMHAPHVSVGVSALVGLAGVVVATDDVVGDVVRRRNNE